jgi:hypothetical protein
MPKNRITEGVFKDACLKTGFTPKPEFKEVRSMICKKEEINGKTSASKTVIAEKNYTASKPRINTDIKWLSNKGEVESDLEDSEESGESNELGKISEQIEKIEIEEYVDKILDD